jgi:DNA invertase Pin-like site-specific DNA recombinase
VAILSWPRKRCRSDRAPGHHHESAFCSSVASRDKLKARVDFAREGDAIVVTKPDRLARSTAELLSIEADLSKRGIGLVVLSMGGEKLDTRNPRRSWLAWRPGNVR